MSSSRFQIEPTFFLIYTNYLADDLSDVKLFANDTSLSSVHNVNTAAGEVNNDLVKINKSAYQWKMSFNLDPIKHAQEIIFTRKIRKEYHPPPGF